jgi:hypothetical protein
VWNVLAAVAIWPASLRDELCASFAAFALCAHHKHDAPAPKTNTAMTAAIGVTPRD